MHVSLLSMFEFHIRRCTSFSPRAIVNVNFSFHVGAVPPSLHTLVRKCSDSPHRSTTYGSCFPNVCVSLSRIAESTVHEATFATRQSRKRRAKATETPRGEFLRAWMSLGRDHASARETRRGASNASSMSDAPFTSSLPRVIARARRIVWEWLAEPAETTGRAGGRRSG